MINFVILLLFTTAFLLVVEIAKRKFLLPAIVTRKIAHIGAAFIAFFSVFFIEKSLIILACFGFAGVMYLSLKSSFFSSIHAVRRNTLGEIYLPLGQAFSAAIFLPQATTEFQYGVLVMGLSDGFAGLIGEKYGKHQVKILNSKKSIEGSLVFLFTTMLLTFLFAPSFGFHLIFIPLALTLTELLLGYGIDNLVIPILGSSLFLSYIH